MCLETRYKRHLLNHHITCFAGDVLQYIWSTKPQRGGNTKFYSFVNNNGGWSAFFLSIIKLTPNHRLKTWLFFTGFVKRYIGSNKLYKKRYQFTILIIFSPLINNFKNIVY